MELWAFIAFIAALAQSLRTVCQRLLIPRVGELGASFSRFIFGIAFAWLWTLLICVQTSSNLPEISFLFFVFVGFAAILQIAFTILLIMMFNSTNCDIRGYYNWLCRELFDYVCNYHGLNRHIALKLPKG